MPRKATLDKQLVWGEAITNPMQVVLLLNLFLDLFLHVQAQDEWITFARCRRGIGIDKPKSLMQVSYRSARAVDLLVDSILEIARKTLDLLSLLLEIAAEASQLADDLDLHFNSFIGLGVTLSVEILEDLRRIGQTTRLKQTRWKSLVINDTRGGKEQLRSSFV
jgi:hypothetical protein